MTLPNSGTLSLSNIAAEFGGSNPISLGNYYAGGEFVPAGTSGVNGEVPTSGALSMSAFYGTTKAPPVFVSAPDASGSASGFSATGFVDASSTANPSGGVTPYTYSWSYVSGSTAPAINSSTLQTPTWNATLTASEQETTTVTAVWRCTVTDMRGTQAHVDINVSLSYTNDSG